MWDTTSNMGAMTQTSVHMNTDGFTEYTERPSQTRFIQFQDSLITPVWRNIQIQHIKKERRDHVQREKLKSVCKHLRV